MSTSGELEVNIPAEDITFFRTKAVEKIRAEGWEGRNKWQKIENFVQCWVTEEAFKKLLIECGAFFRHRALYVGDPDGAGFDFQVMRESKWVSVGIRSIGKDSAEKWKSVAYPEDRFLHEQEKIPDYVVACTHERGVVRFLGMIDRVTLLTELGTRERKRSSVNQEWFRTVGLDKFCIKHLGVLLRELGGITGRGYIGVGAKIQP